ncbi:hypothetical protein DFJ63DRAFT_335566 [Scheffersomyces coipomensis]|uniref:uncharacterized protein n=1 Tax=Scheffersomyces coipomensis TaxID=1788519 RepID=UPI00315D655D
MSSNGTRSRASAAVASASSSSYITSTNFRANASTATGPGIATATATATSNSAIPRSMPSTSSRHHDVLIPQQLNNILQSDKFVKTHFSSLGFDFLRLESYRRFKHLLFVGGGGIIKEVVYDITTFIRKELTDSKSESSKKLKDFLSSNNALLEDEDPFISSDQQLQLRHWLYIIFGYLSQSYNDKEVEKFLDKIIDIYMDSRNKTMLLPEISNKQDQFSLNLLKEYFNDARINYNALYSKKQKPFITFYEAAPGKIYLPPLPKIYNKELLVKALMHREYYRLLLVPQHPFAKELVANGYEDLNHKDYLVLKYELSFLDGLGDLFLAHETSRLIYELCKDTNKVVNNNTYQLLRIILATNTLLSKLTVAYNLHKGLNDQVIQQIIRSEYLPHLYTGQLHPERDAVETRIYEEEFLGDYFECYMAALLIEQPQVAEKFISDIYSEILRVITVVLPPQITYKNWTTGILGRSLYHKN